MSNKPVISVIVPTYNQENYVQEAILSVFSQTYQPLEVILSDDCSKDSTFEIMQKLVSEYNGPHKLILLRNNYNLGVCAHVNKLVKIASGELIVGAAGDDISVPERVAKIYDKFEESGFKAKAIYSDFYNLIDHKLIEGNYTINESNATLINHIKGKFITVGAVSCYHRAVFNKFEPLSDSNAEDNILGFRALLLGQIGFISEKLVQYRRHQKSITGDYKIADKSLQKVRETYRRNLTNYLQEDALILKDYFYYCKKQTGNIDFNIVKLITRRFVWKQKLIELINKKNIFSLVFYSIKLSVQGVPRASVISIAKLIFKNRFSRYS